MEAAVRCSCSSQAAQTVCCMLGEAQATLNQQPPMMQAPIQRIAQHALVAEPQLCVLPYMQHLHNTCTQQQLLQRRHVGATWCGFGVMCLFSVCCAAERLLMRL
jgi:hypothetical protein